MDYEDNWPTNKRGAPKLFVSDAMADKLIRVLGMSEDDFIRTKPLPTNLSQGK